MLLYEVINTDTGQVLAVLARHDEASRLVRSLRELQPPQYEDLEVVAVDDYGQRITAR